MSKNIVKVTIKPQKLKITRTPGQPVIFKDHPEFTPNVTPQEMFELGVFGGTYYRPIYSSVADAELENQHEEFRALGWWDNVPEEHLSCSVCKPSVNMCKVKAGSSLEAWESKGWIEEQDPYGWVQWYCRFYSGRRSEDDERQIERWNKYTGPKSGRWRKNLNQQVEKSRSGL